MGAIAGGGGLVVNDRVIRSLGITTEQLDAVIARETDELRRRELAYRGDDRAVDLDGREVILVDDGIATGASMFAALQAVRSCGPAGWSWPCRWGRDRCSDGYGRRPTRWCSRSMPDRFEAVGQVFADFHQVTDDEVRAALATPTMPNG